jgi:pyruvate dehydrogenase E2 component (dihydrolipoamide acetyltransferase)
MSDVVMPRLSDSMEEGTVLRWLKAEGDDVRSGEDLVEIETDKATMTYQSDLDGVLHIIAAEGETLPLGAVIARVGEAAESGPATAGATRAPAPAQAESSAPAPAPAAPTATLVAEPEADADADAAAEHSADDEGADPPEGAGEHPAAPASNGDATAAHGDEEPERVKASPLARRIARELGVTLDALHGTGPGGRIVKADVQAAAGGAVSESTAPGAAAPAGAGTAPISMAQPSEPGTGKGDVTVQELTRIQQLVARRMAESRATVPDFTLQTEVDMEGCVALRAGLKDAQTPAVPTYNDMVVKACAIALRESPRANGSYRDGRFELHSRVNVGVAVAATDTLIVPTVFDADAKSLTAIAAETRQLAEAVRTGSVTPPQLSGGTFTVSNLGMYGVTSFTAVINPPQAAILAVGTLAQRAVVRDGELVVRHMMNVTLACDHRILYGADAAQFLARIRQLLEQPLALAL